MAETSEPTLTNNKRTTYILKQITDDGTQRGFPGPFVRLKDINEFAEMVKNPKKGGIYYIIKRVETIEETIFKSIPSG